MAILRALRQTWSSVVGFDVFISYRQGRASAYAQALMTHLSAAGFVCFLDQEETLAGVVLAPAIRKALQKSRMLVVIASPEVQQSTWVAQEVELFRNWRGRMTVPVDVGDFLATASLQSSPLQHLQSFTWLRESNEGLESGSPAAVVVEGIQKCYSRMRVKTIGRTIVCLVMLALSMTTAVAYWQWTEADRQRNEALYQLGQATKATERASQEAARANNEAQRANSEAANKEAARRVAVSQALAARGVGLIETDIARALLLSLEALRVADSFEARDALLEVLLASPHYGTLLRKGRTAERGLALARGRPLVMARIQPPASEDVAGCRSSEVRVWDVETGWPYGQPIDSAGCNPVALTPDGRIVAVASCSREVLDQVADTCADGSIVLIDVQTGARTQVLEHDAWPLQLAFSTDGRTLASTHCDRLATKGGDVGARCATEVRDVRSGKWIGGAPFQSSAIALADRGRLLASTVALWDTETRKQVADLSAVAGGATGIAFGPDGGRLVIGGPAFQMAFWDVKKREADGERFSGTREGITHVLFSADGHSLAARSTDGAVEIFDPTTREPKALVVPRDHLLGRTFIGHRRAQDEPNWVHAVAFSSKGVFASGADDGVLLWDVATGRLRARLPQGAGVRSLAFSPDGATLAVGTVTGRLKLWNVIAAKEKEAGSMPEWDSVRRQRLGSGRSYRNYVYSIAFSPDGRHVAAGDSAGSLLVWEVATRKPVLRLDHASPIVGVVFSPDGATLVWSTETTLRVWNVAQRRDRYQVRAPTSAVQSVALSPDGSTLAIGDWSGGIHLWDIAARRTLRAQPLSGHEGDVTALAFTRSGDRLLSSGADGVRVWDVETWNAIGTPLYSGERATVSVAVSPDGKVAASGHRVGTLRVWDVDVASWKALACRMSNRNLRDAEWQAYFRDEEYRLTCADLPKPSAPIR